MIKSFLKAVARFTLGLVLIAAILTALFFFGTYLQEQLKGHMAEGYGPMMALLALIGIALYFIGMIGFAAYELGKAIIK